MHCQYKPGHEINFQKLNEKLSMVSNLVKEGSRESYVAAYFVLQGIPLEAREEKSVRGWRGRVVSTLCDQFHSREEFETFSHELLERLGSSPKAKL
jgi:hypothetical protein